MASLGVTTVSSRVTSARKMTAGVVFECLISGVNKKHCPETDKTYSAQSSEVCTLNNALSISLAVG